MSQKRLISRFIPKKYISLLATFLFMFFVYPLLPKNLDANIVFQGLFTLIMIASVFSVSQDKKFLITGLILGIPSIILMWSIHLSNSRLVVFLGMLCVTLFLSYVMISILLHVLNTDKVTADTVGGAVCVYILLGLVFGIFYVLIYFADSGSFKIPEMLDSVYASNETEKLLHTPLITYFSFITLTTVGYGDVTPVSKIARSFCALEGLLGQLYMTVIIARFVGLYVAHSMVEKEIKEIIHSEGTEDE
jgi:hypothetical protein